MLSQKECSNNIMGLGRRVLKRQEVAYEKEEDEYAEETERFKTLPKAFTDGSCSMGDIEWIVRWKSSRSIGYFERNDREDLTQHINGALAADRISEKVAILTELDRVQGHPSRACPLDLLTLV